ncbi:MAG: acetoacetate--CoA ligase [Bacteroidota bacterium]
MNEQTASPRLLWQPSDSLKQRSNLQLYMDWLRENHQLDFQNYRELWEWSVRDLEAFWASLWDYFDIASHHPYEKVLKGEEMPGYRWFTKSKLNYAEHIFRKANTTYPAIIYHSEHQPLEEMSWADLRTKVAALAAWLRKKGVKKGDTIVGFLANTPEATIAFLATNAIGAVWSSCSPDFGVNSVVDRFEQIRPKVLFAVDGYTYNGKPYLKTEVVNQIRQRISSIEEVVCIPYLDEEFDREEIPGCALWSECLQMTNAPLEFEAVPFEHPIWVLYSSGTTGIPKAITHSHGGVLMEHLKYLTFHNDVKVGERFFWFSTTGWMMWNFVQASLLVGATIVLYDGSPAYPDMEAMWKFAEQAKINHFGTSAPFLVACMRKELQPGTQFDLSALRSIGSTGSPLPPEAFDWVYASIKKDLWLCSMSGGTDVCTAFIGGCPIRPVYEGEIQCRGLGCHMQSWNDEGEPLTDEVGEMVVVQPMPSMPIYFWNDKDHQRYRASYFEHFPGVWRHGDWLKITTRDSLVILGRSDATLNRQGVRIGTSEIYRSVNKIKSVKDSLIVNLELSGGRHYMPLFVHLEDGLELDKVLIDTIKKNLKSEYSPRHVPDEIVAVKDIPYTISGKKLEAPVKKILLGMSIDKAANKDAMRNPEALDFFIAFAKGVKL